MSACTLVTVAVLPLFLLGGLIIFVRSELGFSESEYGVTVSAFFLAAATGSVMAGRLAQRMGSRWALLLGAFLTATALVGAGLSQNWEQLTGALLLAGVANSITQVSSNQLLADEVDPRRQGVAFGAKQAAVPAATLLAGLAIPALAMTVGWRWAFFAASAGTLLAGVTQAKQKGGSRPGDGGGRRQLAAPRGRLTGTNSAARPAMLVLAVSVAFASAAANSLAMFLVDYIVSVGVAPSTAGFILAVGSAAGIAGRVGAGWAADRMNRPELRLVAALLVTGALAFVSFPAIGASPTLFGLAAAVAFAAGWGWPGLVTFIVVQLNRRAPARATGVTQTGVFAGGAIGPLCFGLVVEHLSYEIAWLGSGGALALAAAMVLFGRKLELK